MVTYTNKSHCWEQSGTQSWWEKQVIRISSKSLARPHKNVKDIFLWPTVPYIKSKA